MIIQTDIGFKSVRVKSASVIPTFLALVRKTEALWEEVVFHWLADAISVSKLSRSLFPTNAPSVQACLTVKGSSHLGLALHGA